MIFQKQTNQKDIYKCVRVKLLTSNIKLLLLKYI